MWPTVDVFSSGVARVHMFDEMYWHVQRYLPIISMLRAVSVSLINSSLTVHTGCE